MTISLDPVRPGCRDNQQVLVQLNKGAELKRAFLPARIDLRYQGDRLCFSPQESPFWMELALSPAGRIEGKVFISDRSNQSLAGHFEASVQESPIRTLQEFPEGSPFRVLAESRWLGRDLFFEFLEGNPSFERIEWRSDPIERLELKEGDWLVWDKNLWRRAFANETFEDGKPIARIQSNSPKALILEGWDAEGYVRLSLPAVFGIALKTRGEDLFSSIRIRSDKQISCMLEKQCLILKVGDWVLKTDNRWKVLRNKEEKQSLMSGKLEGDLFVFEQITQKQGQKGIQGRLFNSCRSQAVSIEMTAQSMRKSSPVKGTQGKGKSR